MNTVSDPTALERLVERLRAITPETPRAWGTLTPAEVLCHLGDATASVMARGRSERDPANAAAPRAKSRPFIKWIALRSPLPWPRGLETPPTVDPHADGTKPGAFEADRERAIAGLRAFAAAPASALAASHGAFGRMSHADWQRWAYRHTDHHLRQFGL